MLKIIRYFLIMTYMAITFVIGIIVCFARPSNSNNLYLCAKILAYKSFAILGINFEKSSMQQLGDLGPAVYMSNHQNNLDIFPGAACILPRTVLLGKSSVMWIPIFGQFFWLSGNILIDRNNSEKAKASMKKVTRKILDKKLSVWLMPEGTRSRGRGLLPFKKGGFITAVEAQVPIVPIVYCSYTKKIDLSKWRSGKIIGKVLDPISTKGLTLLDVPALMTSTHVLMKATLDDLDKEMS
ncbi:MAG: 1-acylglycerol-3-phosphate O-acyltransferase [Bdellovibrionota bacterium]